jgi:hypothetical protein
MRALVPVLAAGLSLPCAATAQSDWKGYWAADAAWCANAGQVGDRTPDYYSADGVFGLEWSCEILSVVPTGIGQSWAVRMDCLDMGVSYPSHQIFMITRNDRLLILDQSGETHDLVRCDAPKE